MLRRWGERVAIVQSTLFSYVVLVLVLVNTFLACLQWRGMPLFLYISVRTFGFRSFLTGESERVLLTQPCRWLRRVGHDCLSGLLCAGVDCQGGGSRPPRLVPGGLYVHDSHNCCYPAFIHTYGRD